MSNLFDTQRPGSGGNVMEPVTAMTREELQEVCREAVRQAAAAYRKARCELAGQEPDDAA